MDIEKERARFEAWVSAPPLENSVRRYPDDEAQVAWPGQYKDHAVQLAWDAWQEALRAESD